ncbi:polymorphic toxin-type HINT domain-containing protein [Actinoallomurus iriomotensis]|uniref:Hint domain-containing protein n=1 Tax=Actinoallomurus iriomotensis TaxID=478107 RepID=A0A9W6S5T6_9ACTN|nr:polymorphic toxin-type HINT domain-containing protein [Actinoallomurus iriomotensis]GLY87614.1 hypothetical protein Airi02_055430 [Actinoallomurus iriomotensis]
MTTVGGARDGQTDSFAYDDDGNTKTRQLGSSGDQQQSEQDFVWDLEGQLSSVTKSGQTTSFVYDADGNRLIQHAPDASTLYVAGEEIRLATGTTTPVCTRYYSFGDQTIASRTTTGLTWLVSDQHGTADVSVSGDATQTVTHRRFTPFGQARGTQPATWQGTRGFVGGTIDTALGGLTQLGAREYDPDTGRFLSVDPVFNGSDPQSLNGYSYANDNPTTDSDPTGLMVPCDGGAGGCGMTGHAGGGSGKGPCDIVDCSRVPPPPPQHHCGWTCSVGNFWNKHKAVIVNVTVTIVVTVGCEVATGGAGSLGCAVVGGMAGNWAGYAVSTPQNQQTLGGALKAEAWGAVQGAASWGVGKAGGALWGKLATTVGGRLATRFAAGAASDAESAIGKVASKATQGGEDAAEDAAAGSGKAAAKGGAPHETPSEPSEAPSGSDGCNSFVPGTKVLLEGGKTKNIEDVKVGDKVVATDPKTGKTRLEPVIAAFGGIAYKNLVQITVDTDGKKGHLAGVITATEHHEFWNPVLHQWVRADRLARGSILRTSSNMAVTVVHAIAVPGHPTVRDLTVANFHTFYVEVSATPVLVHNCDGDVHWRKENARMSPAARSYDAGAAGARPGLAPALQYYKAGGGSLSFVKFDGYNAATNEMIDRKLAVTTFAKAFRQAQNQSLALEQNGMAGVWEVPDAAQAARATNIFGQQGITNIRVRIVP